MQDSARLALLRNQHITNKDQEHPSVFVSALESNAASKGFIKGLEHPESDMPLSRCHGVTLHAWRPTTFIGQPALHSSQVSGATTGHGSQGFGPLGFSSPS